MLHQPFTDYQQVLIIRIRSSALQCTEGATYFSNDTMGVYISIGFQTNKRHIVQFINITYFPRLSSLLLI